MGQGHEPGGEALQVPTVQGLPEEDSGRHQLVWTWDGHRACQHCLQLRHARGHRHRVARAGRFGTKGLAITFVSDESDAKTLNEVQERFEVDITELPDEIDLSSYIEGR